jgi:hypothetical protein
MELCQRQIHHLIHIHVTACIVEDAARLDTIVNETEFMQLAELRREPGCSHPHRPCTASSQEGLPGVGEQT